MSSQPEIRITSHPSEWADQAAALVHELREQTIEKRRRFLIALSGGRTPEQLYQRLAKAPPAEQGVWSSTRFFFSDERCVPPDHPESNFNLANRALLRPLNIPSDHVHRMAGERADPDSAARDYERVLRSVASAPEQAWPHLDLVLLGIGHDGHTASLFPHTQAVSERRRWVTVGHAPSDPPFRLTLTLGVINQATVVLFLVTGANKAQVVKAVLEPQEEADRLLPAALVQPERGRLIWLLDGPAAAALTGYGGENCTSPT
jgi:6-phosphogluconolactonase